MLHLRISGYFEATRKQSHTAQQQPEIRKSRKLRDFHRIEITREKEDQERGAPEMATEDQTAFEDSFI